MVHFIFSKKVYADLPGIEQGVAIEGFDASALSGHEVSVCAVDIFPNVIPALESSIEKKEMAIAHHYDNTYVVQDERIEKNLFQVMGIKKDLVEAIYLSFKGAKVVSLVPYALALRAFLKLKGVETETRTIVFIDKFPDQVLLTFIRGMEVSVSRSIVVNEPSEFISEIKRHEQKYAGLYSEKYKDEPIFFAVTNDPAVAQKVVSCGLHPTEAIACFETRLPAIEGIRQAKFNLHFQLPELLLKQKKIKELKLKLKFFAASALCLLTGIIVFSYGIAHKSWNQYRLDSIAKENRNISDRLKKENSNRYKEYFRQKNTDYLTLLVYELFKNLPESHIIDSYKLTKNKKDEWVFEAVIQADSKDSQIQPFLRQGVFKDALIENIVLNDLPSQRITVIVNNRRVER